MPKINLLHSHNLVFDCISDYYFSDNIDERCLLLYIFILTIIAISLKIFFKKVKKLSSEFVFDFFCFATQNPLTLPPPLGQNSVTKSHSWVNSVTGVLPKRQEYASRMSFRKLTNNPSPAKFLKSKLLHGDPLDKMYRGALDKICLRHWKMKFIWWKLHLRVKISKFFRLRQGMWRGCQVWGEIRQS